MDTNSLYLALAEENLDDCILASKRAEWTEKRSKDFRDDLRADAENNFFPRTCCSKHKKQDKREPGLFKEEFRCTEMLCLCTKPIAVTIVKVKSISLAVKVWTNVH